MVELSPKYKGKTNQALAVLGHPGNQKIFRYAKRKRVLWEGREQHKSDWDRRAGLEPLAGN
jgi:hypothetical protein